MNEEQFARKYVRMLYVNNLDNAAGVRMIAILDDGIIVQGKYLRTDDFYGLETPVELAEEIAQLNDLELSDKAYL